MLAQFDDSLKNMQNKIFVVWVALCFAANTIGTAFNFLARGWEWITKLCFGTGVVMIAVVVLAIVFKHREMASVVIFLMLTWIEFPAVYTVYGPIATAYFILSIFAGSVVFPLKKYFIFSITSLIWYGLIIMYESLGSALATVVYNEMTFFIVVVAIMVIQSSILYYYEKQKKKLNDAKQAIEYSAVHDALTGLYNRGFLMEDIGQRITSGDKFILSMIDIDNFKSINDTCGHQTGDEVLAKIGGEIQKTVADSGYGARYGGEELIIVFDNKSEDECRRLLLHIRNSVNYYFRDKNNINVTFSGGIDQSDKYDNPEKLIKSVDDKLYEAKKTGKDKII